MKKIEKRIKKEIERVELNKNILAQVKDECGINHTQKTKKTWFYYLLPIFVSAVMILVICLPLLNQSNENFETYITISCSSLVSHSQAENTSPVIELIIDENEQVLSERGINKAGVIILAGKNPNLTSLETSLENIVVQAETLGYLEGCSLDVMALNPSKDKEKQIEEDLTSVLTQVVSRNMLNVQFGVNANDGKNEYDINQNLYNLILQAQIRFGGDVEDYLDMEYDDLIEIVWDYDEADIKIFENQLEEEIEKIEKEYENLFEHYEEIEEKTEDFLEELDYLIELYEEGDSFAQEIYILLVSNLSTFITEFDEFFYDLLSLDLYECLKEGEISNFYFYFEGKTEELSDLVEDLEDEIEQRIEDYKKNIINF